MKTEHIFLNHPTTTRTTTSANNTRRRSGPLARLARWIAKRISIVARDAWRRTNAYKLGLLLVMIAAALAALHAPDFSPTMLCAAAIGLTAGDFVYWWRQNAPKLRARTTPATPDPSPATPAQDAPPAMDAHERSLANYLSTPHLWN